MTHNTNTPTHNNNVSADKPSTVEAIKEKASAVVNKLTGKHHTTDTHGHGKDHHDPTHTTGTHAHDTTHGTHGTHTAGTNVGADPHAASAAVHSTGAGITSGGNIAPPGATQGTAGLTAAAIQPSGHQNQQHNATHLHDATTTGVHNNHHHNHGAGGMATTAGATGAAAEAAHLKHAHGNNQTHPTVPGGAHLPGTTGMHGTHGTHDPTGAHTGATQNIGGLNPGRVEATIDEVSHRLVGAQGHGDPNNIDPAHIKPTM
ncbi:hypothetical protein EC991_003637 [Linnemannia zychae]|nr:hypothetical protein EC991_003637 [Linnemannia zychae]